MTTPLDPTALRITRGSVTPEEIAALVVVFNAVLSSAQSAANKQSLGVEWNAPHRGIRKTLPHGAGAWRRSALPH